MFQINRMHVKYVTDWHKNCPWEKTLANTYVSILQSPHKIILY